MLFAKNLATTSPRLSQMLIKILDYVVALHHQEGNKMHLSDAISRLSVHDSDAAKSKAKPIADFNISIHEISEITEFKLLTLQDIKEETIKDCQLTKLMASQNTNMSVLKILDLFMITHGNCKGEGKGKY